MLIALGVVVALLIAIRLLLDPIATHETRRALDGLDGFRGDFARVHVGVFPPSYEITRFKLRRLADGDDAEPMVSVERARAVVALGPLLHGHKIASLRVVHPKLVIVAAPSHPKKEEKKEAAPPDLSRQLRAVTALKVDRLEILDGEVLFREAQATHPQELWLNRLEIAAENVATRPSLTGARAATVNIHGRVGRSGELTAFASADPLAAPLSFAGQISVVGFRATELYEFIEPKTHLQAGRGTIDVFAAFVSKNGILSGGIKPVVKNLDVRPADGRVWDRMKAWLADKAVDIGSDRVPDRNAVATTIPIKGRLTDPDIQLWPAVLGIIRNAFVRGLVAGFANVPPEASPHKEGVLTQVKHALTPGHGPPKAQPATVKP